MKEWSVNGAGGHYFLATAAEWAVVDTLDEVVTEAKRMTRDQGNQKFGLLVIAYVPVPKSETYEIEGYIPKVPRTVVISASSAGVVGDER